MPPVSILAVEIGAGAGTAFCTEERVLSTDSRSDLVEMTLDRLNSAGLLPFSDGTSECLQNPA